MFVLQLLLAAGKKKWSWDMCAYGSGSTQLHLLVAAAAALMYVSAVMRTCLDAKSCPGQYRERQAVLCSRVCIEHQGHQRDKVAGQHCQDTLQTQYTHKHYLRGHLIYRVSAV